MSDLRVTIAQICVGSTSGDIFVFEGHGIKFRHVHTARGHTEVRTIARSYSALECEAGLRSAEAQSRLAHGLGNVNVRAPLIRPRVWSQAITSLTSDYACRLSEDSGAVRRLYRWGAPPTPPLPYP